jgi:hypothetical protein
MRELAYGNLFIFYWRIYRMVEELNFTVRKISHLTGTKYQAMKDTANPMLFEFQNEDKNFKILNPSADA